LVYYIIFQHIFECERYMFVADRGVFDCGVEYGFVRMRELLAFY
jgi:hypothetical protein